MGRTQQRLAGAGLAILAALVLGLAAFPWGLVARRAAGTLSHSLGRPVTIGAARRVDRIGFVPTIELDDVRVGQPAWVGVGAGAGHGDMARIARLRVRLPVVALLFGHVRLRSIAVDGLALHLVRDAGGRENWSSGAPSRGGSGGPGLADLTIRGGHIRLDDAKRHVALEASLASDPDHGLRLDGKGMLRGAPLRLRLAAPAITHAGPAQPYPAVLAVRSPLVSIDARVSMAHPLDIEHFSATVHATGHDLLYLDDVIQVGLFRTQPFDLAADVRRDGLDWRIARLGGLIGRSRFTATLDVTRPGGRARLAGRVDAETLDFGDLASDEQRARDTAANRRRGPRVVPGLRILLDKVGQFDGRITLRAATLLSARPSPFRALEATASLDHQRLTLAPLSVGLPKGRMTGAIAVDGHGPTSRLSAKLTMDLRIEGATVESFFPDQQVFAGPMRGRVLLAGSGPTLSGAIAGGRGRIALVVDGGSIRRDYATFLGGDILKSIGAAVKGKSERSPLQCLVGSFALGGGRLVPDPLVLAAPLARGDGSGAIALPAELVDLRMVGRPTRAGLLQSTAPVRMFGTLAHPRIDIRPPRAKDSKGVDMFSRVGFLIRKLRVRGDAEAAPAPPVSCRALSARALR